MLNHILIKIAKLVYAESIKNILQKYLIDKNIQQQNIKKCLDLLNQINPNIQRWFVTNFIKDNKNYQDMQPLLKALEKYKQYANKYHKKLIFDNATNFESLYNFINQFQKKQNIKFSPPIYCEKILQSPNYIFYKADANDEKCFQELNRINNVVEDGYANWCVVQGTRDWGQYTNSKYPFYIYCTKKDNTPFIFFNFGDDDDAQIKDILDNTFTKYNKQIIDDIKQIAQKYNFHLQKNQKKQNEYDYYNQEQQDNYQQENDEIYIPTDYQYFNIIDKAENGKEFGEEVSKTNNLILYKTNQPFKLIITNKNSQLQFIISQERTSGEIIKYGKQKYSSIELIDLLFDNRLVLALNSLILQKKINDKNNKKEVQHIIDLQLNIYYYQNIKKILLRKLITDKQILNKITEFLKSNPKYKTDLIQFELLDDDSTDTCMKELKLTEIANIARDSVYRNIFNRNKQLIKKAIQYWIDNSDQWNIFYVLQAQNISKQDCKLGIQYYTEIKDDQFLLKILRIILPKFTNTNDFKQLFDLIIQQLKKDNSLICLFTHFPYTNDMINHCILQNNNCINFINSQPYMIVQKCLRITNYQSKSFLDWMIEYNITSVISIAFFISNNNIYKKYQMKMIEYLIDNDCEQTLYDITKQCKKKLSVEALQLIDKYFESKL